MKNFKTYLLLKMSYYTEEGESNSSYTLLEEGEQNATSREERIRERVRKELEEEEREYKRIRDQLILERAAERAEEERLYQARIRRQRIERDIMRREKESIPNKHTKTYKKEKDTDGIVTTVVKMPFNVLGSIGKGLGNTFSGKGF